MLKATRISLGLLLFAFCFRASAGNERAWHEIVDPLLKSGIHQIGDLNLDEFSVDAKAIRWLKNPNLPPSELTGNRTSAYYLPNEKSVYLSKGAISSAGHALANLELHEALGALSYNDEKYALSSALDILAKTPPNNTVLKSFAHSIFKGSMVASSGISSVGGGGDINAIAIKNAVFDKLVGGKMPLSNDLLLSFATLNFEPVYSSHFKEIVLEYSLRTPAEIKEYGEQKGVLKASGVQELITIYVPIQLWKKHPAQVVQEASEKVRQIFITNTELPKFKSGSCSSAKALMFNSTNDQDVKKLQRFRAEMLSGCGIMSELGSTVYRIPSLSAADSPESASQVQIVCDYAVASLRDNYSLSVSRHQSSMNTMTVMSPNHTMLWLTLYTNANGKPVLFSLASPATLEIKQIPLQGKQSFSFSREYLGFTIHVSCTSSGHH